MTPCSPTASVQVLNELQRGVRVDFNWSGDRFRHIIFAIRDQESVPLLESVEGTTNEQAPPSPPLTELHEQDEKVFLTGATSVGHWSLSVEARQLAEDREESIVELFHPRAGLNNSDRSTCRLASEPGGRFLLLWFDFACRVKQKVETLGTEYRSTDAARCGMFEFGRVAFATNRQSELGSHVLLGSFSRPKYTAGVVAEVGQQQDAATLRITPAAEITVDLPSTVQWQYGVLWFPA